jgi:hypothetical protein
MKGSIIALALASSFVVSCGADDGNTEPPPGISEKALRVVLPRHTVEPGEHFECFYSDVITDREVFIHAAKGKQGPGGHHLIMYYATANRPVGHSKCDDTEMLDWRQVGAAANDGANEGVIDLPPGVAVKVPAGKQILVQTHYINASGKAREVDDEITVSLLKAEEVKEFANAYAVNDTKFKVPPQGTYSHTSSCKIEKDRDIVLMMGHMHEHGEHYKLELLDPAGVPVETLFDVEWQQAYSSHPPTKRFTLEQPYKIKGGSTLRQTCSWKNTTDQQLGFPTEMCVSFTYYLKDEGFLPCDADSLQ